MTCAGNAVHANLKNKSEDHGIDTVGELAAESTRMKSHFWGW
jgi:hypothetical protein